MGPEETSVIYTLFLATQEKVVQDAAKTSCPNLGKIAGFERECMHVCVCACVCVRVQGSAQRGAEERVQGRWLLVYCSEPLITLGHAN